MQSNVLNDLAEAKRRWKEKKGEEAARPLWYKDDCLILGLNGVLLVQQNKWNCCTPSK